MIDSVSGVGSLRARVLPTAVAAPAPEAPGVTVQSAPPLDESSRLAALFADELEELRQSARQRGYEEGHEQAARDAAAELERQQQDAATALAQQQAALETRSADIAKLLDNLEVAYQNALRDLEPTAVAIAFAGLTRLLGNAEAYRSLLDAMVGNAIDGFGMHDGLRISISPDDFELLRTGDGRWCDRLVVDKRLPPAGCLIEAGPRALDASLMLQLEGLRQRLLEICESRVDETT